MPCFAVRLAVLLHLWANPEWREQFEKAKTTAEMQEVVVAFSKANGYRILEAKEMKKYET